MLDARTLPNGLRLLMAPLAHTRSATVSFYFAAGARYERPQEAGVSHLVEHVCFKGSRRRPTAQAISTAIERVGGVLNAATDREYTVYYAKVPAPRLDLALDVVVDLALRPVFDPAELEKERQVILEELAMVEDSPAELAEVAIDALLWPGQALGRDVAGTPESVRGIPAERATAYHRDQYTPPNAVLAVAGALEPDRVEEQVAALTEHWDFGAPAAWERARPLRPERSRVALRAKPTEQATLIVGLPGLAADHPDRFALQLLVGVLGEGMSSRLFVLLREDLGLVYDVHAAAAYLHDTGAVSMFLGVDPDNAMQALALTLRELARLRQPVLAEELERVREYIKGRMLLSFEDTRAVSAWYGGQALLQNRTRPVEEITAELDAVSTADLERVAAELIDEARLHLAVVGPFESAQPFEQALHF